MVKQVFVYIDAENLAFDTVKAKVLEIKKLEPNYSGKIYGSKESSKNSIQFCLLEGYDFVETSVLSPIKKNLSDSKIIVDCMYDVMTKQVDKVYMLSNDTDFLPLIYTLKKLHIDVFALNVHQQTDTLSSTYELNSELRELGFYSNKNMSVWDNMFNGIKSLVGDRYADDVILEHIDIKVRKFITSLGFKYGVAVLAAADSMDKRNWSYYTVKEIIDSANIEFNDRELADLYIRKIYGFIPKVWNY